MLLDHKGFRGLVVSDSMVKLSVPMEFWIKIRAIKSGIEPMRV